MFRIEPKMPAYAYTTFAIASPISTHFRKGTCDEAGCLAHRHGWKTTVDETSDLGQGQAHYIRASSGRRFVETHTETGLTEFTFEAGQKCFSEHSVPLDRPEVYGKFAGDHRLHERSDLAGRPWDWERARYHGQLVVHSSDSWVNEFGDHQDRIARVVNG